jgi:hypothetical protein
MLKSCKPLEAISTLFMSPLPPENSDCMAQREGAGGAMFKRCNTANVVFRGQPKGLVSVFAYFCVARRSFSRACPSSE